jgi:carotenoid cleavage dioxygenase-like enzyme
VAVPRLASPPPEPADQAADLAAERRLYFATLEREVTDVPLPVTGRLPGWLAGALVRNGPGRFEYPGQALRHWFDGHAMLHRFAFAGGGVRYTNRALRTRAAAAARRGGRLAYREFATDPCLSLFGRVRAMFAPGGEGGVSDNANIAVGTLGGHALALAEGSLPVAFDPGTLETLGPFVGPDPSVARNALTTAHPHYAPDAGGADADGRGDGAGGMVNYLTRFGARCRYEVFAVDAAARRRRVLATIPVREPAYMHSFGLTGRHVVLAEFPFVIDLKRVLLSGRPFAENFRWRPERGTRWLLVDRRGGRAPLVCEGETLFAFHHVNAFDDGDAVVADVLAYDDPSVIDALYLDRARDPAARFPAATYRRYRLTPGRGGRPGRADEVARGDAALELPRLHYEAANARPYRYFYAAAAARPGEFLDGLAKVDVEAGAVVRWAEAGCYAGEPVFAPAPGARREDDGVVLSVVLDARRGRSFLLVLDARTFGEVARAEAPHAIPGGFHGAMLGA